VSSERASVFGGDDDLDVSGFEANSNVHKPTARPEQVRAISEEASFRSREPMPVPPVAPPSARREPRRYRTGRNVQLNLKVRQEAADSFYALADSRGWVLGEAFERAVDALRRELSGG
jgi:hypothetical protein